jgi:diguanylate cyclase (GGDEF)-like protein/PAS domain S-box-containing protein
MIFLNKQERKITLVTGLVLTVLTVVAGLGAYWLMLSQAEQMAVRSLQLAARAQADALERDLHEHIARTQWVATRSVILEPLGRLNRAPDDAASTAALRAAAASLLDTGLTGLAILDRAGQPLALAGETISRAELSLWINTPVFTRLEWSEGPVIVSRVELVHRGVSLGTLVASFRAAHLAALPADFRDLGSSAELAVCGALGADKMRCFPSRLMPRAAHGMPRQVGGQPLPMSRALAGQTGSGIFRDYRGRSVGAGYAPVGDLGPGLVLKIDTAELYAPLRRQLQVVLPVLFGLVALGVLLLRWQALPLVRRTLISEQAARELGTAAADSEARTRAVLDSVDQGILTVNGAGCVESCNPAAERIFGYSAEEVLGVPVGALITGLPDEAWAPGARGAGAAAREARGRRKNGVGLPLELHVSRIELKGQALSIVALRDISQRKAAEEKMLHLASHDTLTGLANRNLLQDRTRQAILRAERSAQHVGVLFIDLDNFKTINDSLGHHVGDRLLQTVAQRVKGCLREGDTVARQGGDEFIVVLPGVARFEDIGMVAGKILQSVSAPYAIEGNELHTSASIGVAVYPEDGEDVEALMRHADIAMYHAKRAGRANYQFFAPDMNRAANERLQLENKLRHALSRDEFSLHFQPIVSVDSGKPQGAEVLLRWHPETGPVGPDCFIPVAEDTGLIVPIGEWVLRSACAQFKTWRSEHCQLARVVVNLSVRQFAQKNLVATVGRILQEAELDPQHLGLEITESLLMENPVEAIRVLTALSDMGVQISIDDFGTGYSSLSYLKRFPIDKIKIDRSFVRDIATDPEDAAIVSAIIAMAHSLDCRVVAEGVETEDQLRFLRERGCDEYQGYYFSRPLPADELRGRFAEFLAS